MPMPRARPPLRRARCSRARWDRAAEDAPRRPRARPWRGAVADGLLGSGNGIPPPGPAETGPWPWEAMRAAWDRRTGHEIHVFVRGLEPGLLAGRKRAEAVSHRAFTEDPSTLVDVAPAADPCALSAARCADRCGELIDVVGAARRATQTPAPAGLDWGCIFATCGDVGSSPRPTSVQASFAPGCITSLFQFVLCYVHARGLHPRLRCSRVPGYIWTRYTHLEPFE